MEKREPVLSMRDLAVSFQASFGKIRAVRGVNMDAFSGGDWTNLWLTPVISRRSTG